jgi:hypothetical protein
MESAGHNFFHSFFIPGFCLFWDSISLCSPGWSQTWDPSASASQMLGLQLYVTMPALLLNFPSNKFSSSYNFYNIFSYEWHWTFLYSLVAVCMSSFVQWIYLPLPFIRLTFFPVDTRNALCTKNTNSLPADVVHISSSLIFVFIWFMMFSWHSKALNFNFNFNLI